MNCHAMLLMCSVDLPACAAILNMKQYNGKYACCYCYDEGRPRPSSHLQRDWPVTDDNELRTTGSLTRNAKDAIDKREPVS